MAVVGISDDKWIIGRQMWDDNDIVVTSAPLLMSGSQLKCYPWIFVREREFKLHSDDKWLLLQIAMTYIHQIPWPHPAIQDAGGPN